MNALRVVHTTLISTGYTNQYKVHCERYVNFVIMLIYVFMISRLILYNVILTKFKPVKILCDN